MRDIVEVAEELGLDASELVPFGRHKAKVDLGVLARPRRGRGRLVLISAITPTTRGEGKTTVSVGLAMGMRRRGRRVAVCLREPSLGPVFGVKGGGTGGGEAQVVPADDINLHFTGDLHAVGAAHNLLAALVDNALHFRTPVRIDPRRVGWPRVLDVNDRALRSVVTGLGGHADGVPRQGRFDITAASEVMAVLALATSPEDLRARLARIVVGATERREDVTAAHLSADAAMYALLRDALLPNLVQTSEGGPAFVHGGPFANIAHGCSSVLATRMATQLADDVITEAGFGFDLGGEKLLHIKCPVAGVWPRCVVLVATVQSLVAHGGGELTAGLRHLDRQLANVRRFRLRSVVALNVFPADSEHDLALVEAHCRAADVPVGRCRGFTRGGAGAEALADAVGAVLDASDAAPPLPVALYDREASYEDKLRAVATALYGAADLAFTPEAERRLRRADETHPGLPVCVAKTHLSFSDDPKAGGLAEGFVATVTDVEVLAGAGFVRASMGAIRTMPGLPREPAAARVRIEPDGRVRGLMQGD